MHALCQVHFAKLDGVPKLPYTYYYNVPYKDFISI